MAERGAPKVSFLVAGVQKAGTTALHDYLKGHPQLCLPRVKEPHFFDDDGLDWAAPDYRAYEALFEDAGSRRCGECTPIYLYWPNCLERIRAYNPDMRIIVSLRDPVQRAWSHYRMELARGAETLTFSRAIRGGRARFAPDTPWRGVHRVHSYVERGLYAEQLEKLYRLFPREQVLVMRAEDLRSDPAHILARLCDFLSIDPFATVDPLISFQGSSPIDGQELKEEDVKYLQEQFSNDQSKLCRMI